LVIIKSSLGAKEEAIEEGRAAAASPTPSLKTLQDILHNRIKQKKGEVHESHSMIYNQNLWREIETLNWVLAQILTLQKIYDSKRRRE
jgi:hypothetical protein